MTVSRGISRDRQKLSVMATDTEHWIYALLILLLRCQSKCNLVNMMQVSHQLGELPNAVMPLEPGSACCRGRLKIMGPVLRHWFIPDLQNPIHIRKYGLPLIPTIATL
jgi:hypothetical protein